MKDAGAISIGLSLQPALRETASPAAAPPR
jgi:hypothetical protein